MADFQHTVLCVDDEQNILSALKRLLRRENFRILSASSGQEALDVLKREEVQLILCDQRMPEMSGTELMIKVRDKYPDTIRIVLTGYSELQSITEAVNLGHIYKLFFKPWDDDNLRLEIRAALAYWDLIQSNKDLNKQLQERNTELSILNKHLEILVKERTQELEIRNQALEISHAILSDLPVAILGVDQDGAAVLVNRQGQEDAAAALGIQVGANAFDVLPGDWMEALKGAIAGSVVHRFQAYPIRDKKYDVYFSPLSGRYAGKGAIITLVRTG